ncbi:MAG: VIT1/CCC1 transporter family protein, partial [Elusimicrobia bacterium]|nr:VIT1/CCC1 transporter family protein [Elusimicrobiota bacterium]
MSAPRDAGLDLVLDELFDLTLYQELAKTSSGPLREVLSDLIPVETRHLSFWKSFFKIERSELDWPRRLKLRALLLTARLLGPVGTHLTLEAIEIYGIRKYLALWQRYRDTELGEAVRGVLSDEFGHEDEIVSRAGARRVDPERVRSVFLGFNDGLVEILGAVSGFFAALGNARLVLLAGVSVAAAGAFSMGSGAYAAASSEDEVERLERGRREFLGKEPGSAGGASPAAIGWLVAAFYLLGALVPLLPVAFGASTLLAPVLAGAVFSVL